MKKQTLIVALTFIAFVFGTANVRAQATTRVDVELSDFIHINVGSSEAAGGVVNFEYLTPNDYNSDKTIIIHNALNISATEKFNVQVKANVGNFTRTNGGGNIPIDALRIQPAPGGSLNGQSYQVTLSQNKQTILKSNQKGLNMTLNLEYLIPENKSSNFLGKPVGVYSGTITYTVAAQ